MKTNRKSIKLSSLSIFMASWVKWLIYCKCNGAENKVEKLKVNSYRSSVEKIVDEMRFSSFLYYLLLTFYLPLQETVRLTYLTSPMKYNRSTSLFCVLDIFLFLPCKSEMQLCWGFFLVDWVFEMKSENENGTNLKYFWLFSCGLDGSWFLVLWLTFKSDWLVLDFFYLFHRLEYFWSSVTFSLNI
jgi:hypothetical protein